MPKRIALIINNNTYQDKTLAQLPPAVANVEDLAHTLRQPEMGNFGKVRLLHNRPAQELRQHLQRLFRWKKRYDVLLLYFVGHTLLAEDGQLYLATVDSVRHALANTAISAEYITQCMDHSFSRQQIFILDTHPCKISKNSAGQALGTPVEMSAVFKGRGRGRVILTATDAVQHVLAGQHLFSQNGTSDFTNYLVQGLRTGAADADSDGQIGVRELHDYIHSQVVHHDGTHRPRRWTYREQDKFIIARNPNDVAQTEPIKWDLIFGAIMAPLATVIIGGGSSLSTSVGMAGLWMLIYAMLYLVLE